MTIRLQIEVPLILSLLFSDSDARAARPPRHFGSYLSAPLPLPGRNGRQRRRTAPGSKCLHCRTPGLPRLRGSGRGKGRAAPGVSRVLVLVAQVVGLLNYTPQWDSDCGPNSFPGVAQWLLPPSCANERTPGPRHCTNSTASVQSLQAAAHARVSLVSATRGRVALSAMRARVPQGSAYLSQPGPSHHATRIALRWPCGEALRAMWATHTSVT